MHSISTILTRLLELLVLACWILPGVLPEISGRLPQTPSQTFSSNEDATWAYFLNKYSSSPSKTYLTRREVQQLVANLQKCDTTTRTTNNSNNYGSSGNSSRTDVDAVDSSLVGNNQDESNSMCSLAADDAHFANISSTADLSQVCVQILYIIDNVEACCTHNSLPLEPNNQPLTVQVDSYESLNAELEGPSAKITPSTEKPTTGEVWGFGILFVTIISACSVVGVSVMPVMGKKVYKYILTTMIGLAVGSLIGSAVFHLMPSAFDMRTYDPHHDYLYTALVVTGGIWMFFMVERILKLIMDHKDRIDHVKNPWKKPKKSINYSTPESSTNSILPETNNPRQQHSAEDGVQSTSGCTGRETEFIYETQEQAIKASFGHQDKPKNHGHDHMLRFEQGKDSVIATVAWMIIFGDGLHNFIDGLSIGAAFNESILTGVSISVAVFCEELPHELGDFAVLLNAGMTMRQALVYNFLSACTCYLGLAVGIFLGEVQASGYIFGVATGMFLYIALVDMVPEMNEVSEKASKVSVKKGLMVLLIQNIGIFVGIFALFILAKYQDNIKF